VVDHLADVESDMSVFHRVDDMYALDGPRFFRLAVRLPFYKGVIRAHVMAEIHERDGSAAAGPRVGSTGPAPVVNVPGHGPGTLPAGARYTDGDRAALQANPVFRDLIEFGTGGEVSGGG